MHQFPHKLLLFLNMCIMVPMSLIMLCTGFYMFLLFITIKYDSSYILFTILMVYTFYMVYDRNDGPAGRRYYRNKHAHKNYDNARNWSCFKYMAAYFPMALHKTVDITEQKPYIFLYIPHGVIGMGSNAAMNTNGCGFDEMFPNLGVRYAVTLDAPFYVPFLRDIMIRLGFVHPQKSTLEHILRNRRESIVLVPGGAMEALYTQNSAFRCIMKTAPIRLALSTNATIIPCIGFGENDAFRVHMFPAESIFFRIQKYMCQKFSFSTPVLLSPFAQRRPINVVIGKPIDFVSALIDRNTTTTDLSLLLSEENIMKCQKQYVAAVEKLYNDHKDRFGYANIPLEWLNNK